MPYYRLVYHIVWSTYKRLPLINEHNRDTIHKIIVTKIGGCQGIVHAINSMPDHIHIVATIPPSIALATLIGQLKGSTSFQVARLSSTEFRWQAEYGIISVSESHLPLVVRYVQLQQQHHAENTLNKLSKLASNFCTGQIACTSLSQL